MHQLTLDINGDALEGAYTTLQGDLDPALLPRLRAARIELVSMQYSTYWECWMYGLRKNWRGTGATTITKDAQGVRATLEWVNGTNKPV